MLTPSPPTNQTVQTARRHWTFWLLVVLTLLWGFATVIAPIYIIRTQFPYPDLNVITIIGSVGTVVTLMIAWPYFEHTASIQTGTELFTVRKYGQTAFEYPYAAITGHTVRPNFDRQRSWTELVVYLPDNWFALRSIDFEAFDELVALFSAVSPVVPYRQVLSPSEQRLARGFLIVALLAGLAPVWFGFAAHQPVRKSPAPLVVLVGYVFDIKQTTNRNNAFMGYDLKLVNYPDFTFRARKTSFNDSLRTVPNWFAIHGNITLLIREHDLLTKISRKRPLTFADKYDGYQHITSFGIGDQSGIRLRSNQPAYNDSHTKPYLRMGFFVLYAIVIWSFWLAVDKQTIRH